MHCRKEICWVVHVCSRNPFPPFFLGIKSIHSLLVPEAWASWERNAPPLQKKTSLMQRSRRVGNGVVACKICFDIPDTDCAPVWLLQTKLLASVGWKWGCQPFSCRCSQNVTHCRKEICSTCLFKESFLAILFWNSKHPLPTRTRSLSFLRAAVRSASSALNHGCVMPIASSQLQKKPVICREAEGLITELWSPRFVTIQWLCSQLCYVTAANQRTLVQIELLATEGWKWGCQPFSCPYSQNVTLPKGDFLDILV